MISADALATACADDSILGLTQGYEALMSVLSQTLDEQKPIPLEDAIEELASFFVHGPSVTASEVERLWGIQLKMAPWLFLVCRRREFDAMSVVSVTELASIVLSLWTRRCADLFTPARAVRSWTKTCRWFHPAGHQPMSFKLIEIWPRWNKLAHQRFHPWYGSR